jgi:hypothetical protein
VEALPQEKLSVEAERRNVLADLRSGDFTKQRLACERLSVLAEDHFPNFLPIAIGLISDANRLDDRIRERTITPADEKVEIQQLIEATVKLLNRMGTTEPVGRIPLDQIPPAERAQLEEELQPRRSAEAHTGSPCRATLNMKMTKSIY